MSKKSSSRTGARKPATVRVDLTVADIVTLVKAFAQVRTGEPPDDNILVDAIDDVELKILNASPM